MTKKVFDVLSFLILNRERVVSREELLASIWDNRIVVDNVLARTVMLGRAAIGDFDAACPIIKTITRVGYRFIAECVELRESAQSAPAASEECEPVSSPPLRLAVLPFLNQTGVPTLVWAELGLMSLVIKSLSENPRLSMVSTSSILSCLDRKGAGKSLTERLEIIFSALGAHRILFASVMSHSGSFRITYRLFSRHGEFDRGNVSGLELTQLGLLLAKQIEAGLLSKSDQLAQLDSADPFVNECLARGMCSCAESRWSVAEKFLGLAHALERDNVAIAIQYAYSLARLGESEAITMGHHLIELAKETGNVKLEMRACYVTGLGFLFAKADTNRAQAYVDQSLALATEADRDWYTLAISLRTVIASRHEDSAAVRGLTQLGIDLSERSGDKVQLICHLINRSVGQLIDDAHGALVTASDAVDLCARFGQLQSQSIALTNLFEAQLRIGLFLEAQQTVREFARCVREMNEPIHRPLIDPIRMIGMLISLCKYSEARSLIQDFKNRVWVGDSPLCVAFRVWSDAYSAEINNSFHESLDIFKKAWSLLAHKNYWHELRYLSLELSARLCQEMRFDEALQVLDRTSAFKPDANDPTLPLAMRYVTALQTRQVSGIKKAQRLLLDLSADVRNHEWVDIVNIDLAFLNLCEGQLEAAEALLYSRPQAIMHRPEGVLVSSLLHQARAEEDEAEKAISVFRRMTISRRPEFSVLDPKMSSRSVEVIRTLPFPSAYISRAKTLAASSPTLRS